MATTFFRSNAFGCAGEKSQHRAQTPTEYGLHEGQAEQKLTQPTLVAMATLAGALALALSSSVLGKQALGVRFTRYSGFSCLLHAVGGGVLGQLNIPSGLTNVISIAAGTYNGFAAKADGTVAQWGNGPIWQSKGINTQLSVAAGMSNIAAVAAGSLTAWSLDNTGTTWSWGWGGRNINFNIATVAAADDEDLTGYGLLLQDNGIPSIPNNSGMAPLLLPGMGSNTFAISAGYIHAAIVCNDGTPRIAKQLSNRAVYAGSTVYFHAAVVSSIPLSYQWQFNGTNLDGATNVVLALTNVPLTAAGGYSCIATNSRGAVTNLNARLTVLRSAPQFGAFVSASPHGFGWQLNHLSGHGSIVILASTNLVDWVPVFTNPPVTGSIEFHDTDSIVQAKRFYRAVEQ